MYTCVYYFQLLERAALPGVGYYFDSYIPRNVTRDSNPAKKIGVPLENYILSVRLTVIRCRPVAMTDQGSLPAWQQYTCQTSWVVLVNEFT